MLNRHFPHVEMNEEKLLGRLEKGAVFFVAENNGKIIGFVDLRLGGSVLVRGLAVEPRWRGKGVGSALLEKVIGFARKEGRSAVWIKVQPGNLEAVKIYQKAGFVPSQEITAKNGEQLLLMKRKLET